MSADGYRTRPESGIPAARTPGGRPRDGRGVPPRPRVDPPEEGTAADDGLTRLFDEPAAEALRTHWAERGVGVRAQAAPWERSGYSGARLGLVVLGHPDRTDERVVVKLLPGGPDTAEADLHERAAASAPAFASAHVVAQAYPPCDLPDGRRLMFQRLPQSVVDVVPLSAVPNGDLRAPCAELTRTLFDVWNPDRALRSTTVGEFLAGELRSALEPGRSARRWARDVLMIDTGTGMWIRDETEPHLILPNPALIARPDSPIGALPLDRYTGRSHGDLHLDNVLVASEEGRPVPGRHWLIDLAHYRDEVPLSRDVAALVLALVDRRVAELRPHASAEARALIDIVVDPVPSRGDRIGAGVVDALREVDKVCRECLPGDVEVWRAQYLWSVVAEALVHTSYEAAGDRVRWWYSRLAAHAARAALEQARNSLPAGVVPSVPASGDFPLVGPHAAAARRAREVPERLLRTRAEVVAAVRGRWLLPEELPFFRRTVRAAAIRTGGPIAPVLTPRSLVPEADGDRLPDRTVLLGAPGTGKSRWCLEVAALAEEAGSPVHFLGGIDGGSAELLPLSTDEVVGELSEALSGRTAADPPALLVIDGLDRFPGLDLPGLHEALLDLAHRGRPVGLLATSRRGTHWTSQLGRGAAALLAEVRHLPEEAEYRAPLLRSVLRRSAGHAVRASGASAVLAALGNDVANPLPPASAAMWSVLLERAAEAGEAAGAGEAGALAGTTAGVSPTRGAADSGASPGPVPGPLLPEGSLPEALFRHLQGRAADPETAGLLVLLPVAAVLASAPLPPDRLAAVADEALSATARALGRTARHDGADLVRLAHETGLLHLDPTRPGGHAAGRPEEPVGGTGGPGRTEATDATDADTRQDGVLVVAHPLACDTFLAHVTRHGTERAGMGLLLDAALTDTGAFANTAASVTRWFPTAPEAVRDRFDGQAGLWFHERAEVLGRTLAEVGHGAASVLEFLLFTRPWHRLTYVHWTSVAGPWFARPEATPVDPLLLARALYEDRNEDRRRIVELAFSWLDRHARDAGADRVLRWLLRRHETRGPVRDRALLMADVFLEAHPEVRPNHVLAAAFVQQRSHDPDRTGPLAERALEELRGDPGAETNAPLLAALLSRRDVEDRILAEALEMAKAHLASHPLASTSNEVLKWLLVREEVSGPDHRRALASSDLWLAENARHPRAGHVLSGLMLDDRVDSGRLRAAAALSVDWLELNWPRRPAIWVLTDLMHAERRSQRDQDPQDPFLPEELRSRLATVTCTWLVQWERENVTPDTAARVLRATHRTAGGPALARALLRWTEEHSAQSKAFPALGAVLAVSGPGLPLGTEAIGPAMKWLRAHHRAQDATVVLQALLKHKQLAGGEARKVYAYALSWLERHGRRNTTALHVVRWMLSAFKREAPDPEQLAAAVDHVITLLDRLLASDGTPRQTTPTTAEADGVDIFALQVHLPMLRAALTLPTDPDRASKLRERGKLLLADEDLRGQWGLLVQSLLGPRELPGEFVTEVITQSLDWLDTAAVTEQAAYALKGLVRRKEIGAGSEEHVRMCAAARAWLGAQPEHQETGSLVAMFLSREDIDAETARVAVAAGTAWLSTSPPVEKAGHLLARLLPLAPPDDDRVVAHAREVLREDPPWPWRSLVLGGLLQRRTLSPGESAWARQEALTLVADHPYERIPGILIQRLLDRDDLTEQEERDAMEHARGWWHHHHEQASAPYLAEAMLARPQYLRRRLGNRSWEQRIVDDLVGWLGAGTGDVPNEVRGSLPTAVRLIKDRSLTARQRRAVAERADHWLTARPGDPDAAELAGWVLALLEGVGGPGPFGSGPGADAEVIGRLRAVAEGPPGARAG
ncbi:hypothetical protein [Streptomyces sp. NPDC097619]|uniref:hypothetical protein n=1 Tax=Streptomyces sp. NPDC097619 TaxID=3157228 RepID=UPI00332EBE85